MTTPNPVKALFDSVAERYDNPHMRYFPAAAVRLVQHLAPRPGDRILDVATGTGHVALAVARAVQPDGRVQAIDLSPRMLDRAFINLQRAGLSNVDLHEMDASRPDFASHSFDALTCSFGLFFLPDMLSALREWRRVLRPGGRLLLTSFTQNAFMPLAARFLDRLAAFGVDTREERWRRLAEPAECEDLLRTAGFTDVQITTEQLGFHLDGPEDWWTIIQSSGYRGLLDALDEDARTPFREQHLAELRALETEQGLWLNVETLFIAARRPAE